MIVIYYRTHTQKQEQMTLENKNDMITTQQPGQKNILTTRMRRSAGALRKDNTYGSQRIFRKNTDAQTQILRKIHTQIWRKNTNK